MASSLRLLFCYLHVAHLLPVVSLRLAPPCHCSSHLRDWHPLRFVHFYATSRQLIDTTLNVEGASIGAMLGV